MIADHTWALTTFLVGMIVLTLLVLAKEAMP